MTSFKFTRREKVILTIVGMLLLLRLIITLIIFAAIRLDPSSNDQSVVAATDTASSWAGANCGLAPSRRCNA